MPLCPKRKLENRNSMLDFQFLISFFNPIGNLLKAEILPDLMQACHRELTSGTNKGAAGRSILAESAA